MREGEEEEQVDISPHDGCAVAGGTELDLAINEGTQWNAKWRVGTGKLSPPGYSSYSPTCRAETGSEMK